VADVWVPGWTIRRFTDPKSSKANANEIACAHTQVGSYEGAWDWGNQDGNPYPQSYIRCSGEGVNAWPVNLRCAANLEGNHRIWAIETEDVDADCFAPWNLTCGNVPAWTKAQVETLIEGFTWWCLRFNRPPVIIPDAKPGRVGLGYHRFGVPNSPEWVSGAEKWTTSEGKCCPDWRRIDQFRNQIVPEVARRVSGQPPPKPIPPPEEEDMKDLLVSAEGRSPAWVRGDKVIPLLHASSRDNLASQGKIEKVTVTPVDYDKMAQVLGAPELVDDVSTPNP
jgi:hypothetical protein